MSEHEALTTFVSIEMPRRIAHNTGAVVAGRVPRYTGAGLLTTDETPGTIMGVATKGIVIPDPLGSEDEVFLHVPAAVTITRIYAETDTGTVTLKVKWRAEGGAFSGGTEVHGTSIVATASGAQQSSGFADATIPAASLLAAVLSGTTGAPNRVLVLIDYTVD